MSSEQKCVGSVLRVGEGRFRRVKPNLAAIAPPYLRQLFAEQLRVIGALALERAESRRVVALCGRRAGKTVTAAAACAWALQHAGFDESVVYGARTRGVAKGLIWAKLRALAREAALPWRFNEAELTITTDKGAKLFVVGFDKSAEVEKLRGLKMRLFVADEPATYAPLLDSLLRDVVEPALGDLRGSVLLCGTPGMVCAGFWFEASTGVRKRWRRHTWTILNNPHFPDPAEHLADVLHENGWDETNVTYRREYLSEWVADDSELVYRYIEKRNNVTSDKAPRNTPTVTIGVDFGMNDECAWVVLGSEMYSRETYVLEAIKEGGLLPSEAAERTMALCERYNPSTLVGDSGGLGKPYVEAFNRRYADRLTYRMIPADKREKRGHIELLNGDLRSGRLRLVTPAADALAEELRMLPWKDAHRMVEHPEYPNHASDAMLYAWRHHTAYLATSAPKPYKKPTPDDEEWIEQEAEEYRRDEGAAWWDR